MYRVYFLDGYEIKNVENVDFDHQRNIIIREGLGRGKFPQADQPDLKNWTVKSEQSDPKLFDMLESMLKTKANSRLVITSDAERISELVYLESYTKNEVYSGSYIVSMKFVEYIEASVKTIDIPFIPRSGKMPTPPKTVSFNGADKTPYKALKGYTRTSIGIYNEQTNNKLENLYLQERTTGKAVNPCLVEKDKEYNIVWKSLDELHNQIINPMMKIAADALLFLAPTRIPKEAMNKAYAQWKVKQEKNLKN